METLKTKNTDTLVIYLISGDGQKYYLSLPEIDKYSTQEELDKIAENTLKNFLSENRLYKRFDYKVLWYYFDSDKNWKKKIEKLVSDTTRKSKIALLDYAY